MKNNGNKRGVEAVKEGVNGGKGAGSKYLYSTLFCLRNNTGVFYVKGHKRDTNRMGNFSKPKLNKSNPEKWFLWYNYRVPEELSHLYSRGWLRFKVYDGINKIPLNERGQVAADMIVETTVALRNGWLNPFEEVKGVIVENEKQERERERCEYLCSEAFPLFIASKNKLEPSSIIAYQGTIDWLLTGLANTPVGEVRYVDISATINKVAIEPLRNWSSTTINTQWGYTQTIFNWLALEDFIVKNPAKGKVIKLPTKKSKHKWYDRDTARQVRCAILASKTPWLINVCQFTYEILIRSKKELMSIKVGDIDMELRRVNFRSEWTKNGEDQSRDYSDSFHELLLEMGVDTINKDWYIFGKGGKPGPVRPGHNFFSLAWDGIRSELGLSDKYTLYGWKHTAIVHDMMKFVEGYNISHKARHSNPKTTDDYKRDYDITLLKVYKHEDLFFWPERHLIPDEAVV